MNYGELKTLVANFAKRTEDDIEAFVAFSHAAVSAEFEAPDSMGIVELANPLPVSGAVYSWELPDDVLRVREVLCDNLRLDNTYLTDLFMLRGSRPWAYVVEGLSLLVAPGQGTSVAIRYQKRLPDLVADTDTNWLLTNWPQLYLYKSLVHLHEYVQDAEQVAICQTMYEQAAALAGQQIQQLKQGGQPIIRSA